MGITHEPAAGRSFRLASVLSATCGAAALGLAAAGCYGLADAAGAVFGLAAPELLVRLAAALVGLPLAVLAEDAVFRLVSTRRAPQPDVPILAVKMHSVRPPDPTFAPLKRLSRARGRDPEELPWTEERPPTWPCG